MITADKIKPADNLLLELPIPFRQIDGSIYAEYQASNGIQRWMDNFKQVTVCAPLVPEALVGDDMKWVDIGELLADGRLSVCLLPWGYHPRDHFAQVKQVRKTLRDLIEQHEYLLFCDLGWLGAWGNTAAEQATSLGRPYAVWLDWVLHDMPEARGKSLAKNAWKKFNRWMLKKNSLSAINRAALGLFHGRTVFDGYAPHNSNPHLVHDVHLKQADIIDSTRLAQRLEAKNKAFKIVYLGRVHPMKDPLAWIATVAELIELAGDEYRIEAVWMGGGAMIEECRNLVQSLHLESKISFPGVVNNRPLVLEFLRSADMFLFCHVTPESPRCLIEALMSGLPLVGFESEYAKDLIAGHGGGRFVPIGATKELAKVAYEIIADKSKLEVLTNQAYEAGNQFSDVTVFKHRSDLIKKYLGAP